MKKPYLVHRVFKPRPRWLVADRLLRPVLHFATGKPLEFADEAEARATAERLNLEARPVEQTALADERV